jgi:hypothetical protein
MRLGVVWLKSKGAIEMRQRFVKPVQVFKDDPQIVVSRVKARVQIDGALIVGKGLIGFASRPENVAQIINCLEIIGINGKCAPETLRSLGMFALQIQRDAQIVERFSVVLPEDKRAPVSRNGLIQPVLVFQNIAKAVVIKGNIALRRDGFPDQFGGGLMPADLMRQYANQMQAVGVVWIEREDLPVKPLRLRQPSGLMVLERFVK